MSLTNPNKVVTEQRLNEYHQTILPYLGGMPEMVANKFSKGDLYSTEEKMIGQWIDGKPLYQKTVDCGAMPNNGTKTVSSGLSNVIVINIFGAAISTEGIYPLPSANYGNLGWDRGVAFRNDLGNVIELNAGYDRSNETAYVTIQYTKTTDSAISIGSDTDYSTEEKIVGTWIDGKPIYQKTYVFSSPVVITANTYFHSNIIISNLDSIISGMLYDNLGQVYSADFGIFIANHEEVAIRHSTEISITKMNLQYTKTTD